MLDSEAAFDVFQDLINKQYDTHIRNHYPFVRIIVFINIKTARVKIMSMLMNGRVLNTCR